MPWAPRIHCAIDTLLWFAVEVPQKGHVTLTYVGIPVMRTRIKLEALTMCTFTNRGEDGALPESSGEDVLKDVQRQVMQSDLSVAL